MFPFSPSSLELSQSSQNKESFSEAFLDTSSVRDALPEQYRVHFDELRGNILAFCHEFKIPIETLRSKEAFGAELTSKRIPPERMAEVASLFARLEYLVTHKEPLKEILPEYLEEAEHLYHLKEQYDAQVSLLERVGILEGGVITGIDGHEYPIPTLEQIAQRLYEQREKFETKRDQGFTKFLLVPFGMSFDALCEIFRQFLFSYKQAHPPFDLSTSRPFWTWEGYKGADIGNPPRIVYNPQSFDDHHQGQTKHQVLESQADNQDISFPGWRIHLLQPSDPSNQESKGFAIIPQEGRGKIHGEQEPRPDIETNKTPTDYLFILQKAQDDPSSPYSHESGLTPEDWIFAFMTHLEETGKPLDDYERGEENSTYLIGAFFPSSANVPYAFWSYNGRQACLNDFDLDARNENMGVRTSVII